MGESNHDGEIKNSRNVNSCNSCPKLLDTVWKWAYQVLNQKRTIFNCMKFQHLRLAIAALVSFHFSIFAATVHYVDANGTNPVSPYTSWATAATNIQDAVNFAGGGTVLVTNGIYQYGSYSANGNNRVYVFNNQTVQSVNGPAVTTILGYQVPGTTNGSTAIRCVYLSTGSVLSGFTLTNGAAQNNGGGMMLESQCVISNCIITGNAAAVGAGVYSLNQSSSNILVNSLILGNIALSGGSGGGAFGCKLINCVLSGNKCGYRGAAAEGCTLINCTVVTNIGQADGIDGCNLKNCISYYNFPDNGESSGDGTSFSNCCVATIPTFNSANNFTNPPAFVNLASGDYHLSPASPCINAGNNTFVTVSNDLDGNPRIVAGTVDIGAYEFQSPIHYVSISNTAPVSPFTNWITAATNIQDAIDAASAGDFVIVSNGTYNAGGRIVYGSETNRVVLTNAVTLMSVNGPTNTLIVGGIQMRCIYVGSNSILSGFTLTNGHGRTIGDVTNEQSGGGAWCEAGGVISNCIVTGSSAGGGANGYGNGIYGGVIWNSIITNNNSGYVGVRGGGVAFATIFNCTILTNHGSSGSGAYSCSLSNCTVAKNVSNAGFGAGVSYCFVNNSIICSNQGYYFGGGADSSTLTNCKIFANFAFQGGGASSSTLNNCVVVANTASSSGGGAYFSTLNNCVISNNSAQFGGGIYFGTVNNSLISSNRASSGGGAYSNILNNCILQNNFAGNTGGGAFNSALVNCAVVSNAAPIPAPAPTGGGVTGGSLNNCILYYNSGAGGSNFLGNVAINYCCTTPLPTNGVGNITNAPLFVNVTNDFHLQSNSPCINAGNNSYITNTTDFDGNPRIVGGTVDIGAYEYQTPSSILSYAWAQQYGLPTDGSADYLDSDGDGMNNWQEWKAGTIPTNAASVLKLSSPSNSVSGVTVTWQSVGGVTYYLQSSTNLAAQPAFFSIQSNILGQAGSTSYTDTTATNGGPYFYRVGVQ
jgi:hypothetical protein